MDYPINNDIILKISTEKTNIFSIFEELEKITQSNESQPMKNSLIIGAFFQYIKDNYSIYSGETEETTENIRFARDQEFLSGKFPEYLPAFERSIRNIFSKSNIKIYSADDLILFKEHFKGMSPPEEKLMPLAPDKPKSKKIKKKNKPKIDDHFFTSSTVISLGTWKKQKLPKGPLDEINYINSQPKPIIDLVQLSIQLQPPPPYYQVKLMLEFNKKRNFKRFSKLLSPEEGSEERFSNQRKKYYYYCDLSDKEKFKSFLEKISTFQLPMRIAEIIPDVLTEFDLAQQQENIRQPEVKKDVSENTVMAEGVSLFAPAKTKERQRPVATLKPPPSTSATTLRPISISTPTLQKPTFWNPPSTPRREAKQPPSGTKSQTFKAFK